MSANVPPLSAFAARMPECDFPPSWLPQKQAPRLIAGTAHVWLCPTDLPETQLDGLSVWLAPDELGCAEKYRHTGARTRFVVARSLLRCVLAAYLRQSPRTFRFATGEHGKPDFAPQDKNTARIENQRVAFNVSHTESLALVALSLDAELGVDVEGLRENLELENIARRYFAPAEFAELLRLRAPERLAAFYHCWTRKEAVIKALGAGFAFPLKNFRVSLDAHSPARLLEFTGSADEPRNWSLHQLPLPAGYTGALASRPPLTTVECFTPQA